MLRTFKSIVFASLLVITTSSALADTPSESYLAWKRTPISQRMAQLITSVSVNLNAKLTYEETIPTKKDPYSYSVYTYPFKKTPAKCRIVMVYDNQKYYGTWARDVNADSQQEYDQTQLLIDGFIFTHEAGHCVHFNKDYKFPTKLVATPNKKLASELYQEIYADLYALAVISKRMDLSLFSKLLIAVYNERLNPEAASSHQTFGLLKDFDANTYDILRNMPQKKIPEAVHKAAVEYTIKYFEDNSH